MPTTPRKSSLGGTSRRGPHKAHIPYRGDNPEVGKKTGITVQHVQRQSDGFEPFEQVLLQADGRTPPRPKRRKKSLTVPPHQDEDNYGDDGEESMQLDSPISDGFEPFDQVSPQADGRTPPRPKRRKTSLTVSPHQDENNSGDDGEESMQLDSPISKDKQKAVRYEEPGQDAAQEPSPSNSSLQISARRQSFNQIDQDEDDDGDGQEEEEEPTHDTSSKSKQSKDKGKAARHKEPDKRSPRQGVRRSQREHYRPLEYWRGEKLVYGRIDNSGPILVPQIKEILRIPKEIPIPLGRKRKRRTTPARSQSKVLDAIPVVNPEEGWDDDTESKCIVIHYTTRQEVERRIAWTAKMVQPRPATNHSWSFDKIFGDDEFIAAGQLIIPPNGRKPSKAAKDNTYIFYVIEGAVNFKIHETSLILAAGGMFMVPRGNTYFIENICNRDAKLFFTQARKVEMSKEESIARADTAVVLERRKSAVRSSSAGPPSKVPTPNGRSVPHKLSH